MKNNGWGWFWISIGTLLIMIAPTTNAMIPQVVSGLAFIILGIYLGYKKK